MHPTLGKYDVGAPCRWASVLSHGQCSAVVHVVDCGASLPGPSFALLLSSCGNLGEELNLSESQWPHL